MADVVTDYIPDFGRNRFTSPRAHLIIEDDSVEVEVLSVEGSQILFSFCFHYVLRACSDTLPYVKLRSFNTYSKTSTKAFPVLSIISESLSASCLVVTKTGSTSTTMLKLRGERSPCSKTHRRISTISCSVSRPKAFPLN